MRTIVLPLLAFLHICPITSVEAAEQNKEVAVAQARVAMDAFLTAFNARDASGVADTLLFPHVRVASGGVQVIPNKAAFVAATDMDQFAIDNDWDFSEWDSIDLIQAGAGKMHFKVRFSRFNPQGERYVTYDSLYVLQKQGDRWGIRARSSFAP